jgi:predicted porin
MKKQHSLLVATAAALLACSAQAQTQVNLYGLVDMSVGATKAPGASFIRGADSGKMSTSFFGLSGSEDLGDGLSAFFTLDSFLRADVGNSGRFNGDNFWARNAFVGLASKTLGSIKLGRNTTPLFVSTLAFNAFGDSFGYSPSIRHYFSSGTVSGDSGWSDSVLYTSPKFGGATVGLIAAAGEGAGRRNWGAQAHYAEGAFAAAAVYQKVGKDASTAAALDDTATWQLSASYDFGAAKLFGQAGKVENQSTGRDYRIAGIGAAVPLGGGKILAQYGQISPSTGAKRKTFTAGYDYLLSKRTDLYAAWMSDKLDGLSSGASYSLGVRHRF